MRYSSFNFSDSFSNASGSRRENMALGELGKVINQHPFAVRSALSNAGVNVSPNLNRRGIAKIIHKNRENKDLIKNLSALVLLNAKYDEGYGFLGRKNKDKTADDGTEKKGLFKKIGKFFKDRKERKNTEKLAKPQKEGGGLGSQIGGLIRDNKGELMDIGGGLLGGLLSRGGGSTLQQQSVSPNNQGFNPNNQKPPMPLGTKIAIGVGILGILGVTIYLVRKNNKG